MSRNIQIPSRERREKQHFFIGGTEVFGVQSLSCSYNAGYQPLEFLGMSQTVDYPNNAQVASISCNSLMLGADSFINYTGDSSFSGYIVADKTTPGGQNFSFTSAYLTSYQVRCSVGQIPEIATEILAVGDAGRLAGDQYNTDFAAISASTAVLTPQIASYSTIEVSMPEFSTNRLQSFQVSIQSPRNPIYKLGSRTPYLVDLIYPLRVDASFTMDVNDFLSYRLNSFPCSPVSKDIIFAFNEYGSGANVMTYSFSNMRFQGMKYSTEINGSVSVSVEYSTFIEAPFPLSSSLKADTDLITADTTLFTADYY